MKGVLPEQGGGRFISKCCIAFYPTGCKTWLKNHQRSFFTNSRGPKLLHPSQLKPKVEGNTILTQGHQDEPCQLAYLAFNGWPKDVAPGWRLGTHTWSEPYGPLDFILKTPLYTVEETARRRDPTVARAMLTNLRNLHFPGWTWPDQCPRGTSLGVMKHNIDRRSHKAGDTPTAWKDQIGQMRKSNVFREQWGDD